MRSNRIEEVLKAIADNKTRYAKAIDALRRNRDYSDAGRDNLADQEWKRAKQKHESLKDELEEALASERARLERQAFNAPRGNETAYRDAISRASSFTDTSSREKAIQLAIKTSDTVMLRALAAVSHSQNEPGWNTVRRAAEFDRDISALVDFEKEHGVLRDKAQMAFAPYRSAPSKPNFPAERRNEPERIERNPDGTRAW